MKTFSKATSTALYDNTSVSLFPKPPAKGYEPSGKRSLIV
jgi:hypothetical protein